MGVHKEKPFVAGVGQTGCLAGIVPKTSPYLDQDVSFNKYKS